MRDETTFLTKVKRALMISEADTFADEEIKLHISACENLLISTGISEDLAKSDDSLVEGLILIYVKTYFGFKSDGGVKELPASFDFLVKQLVLTKGEYDVS